MFHRNAVEFPQFLTSFSHAECFQSFCPFGCMLIAKAVTLVFHMAYAVPLQTLPYSVIELLEYVTVPVTASVGTSPLSSRRNSRKPMVLAQ